MVSDETSRHRSSSSKSAVTARRHTSVLGHARLKLLGPGGRSYPVKRRDPESRGWAGRWSHPPACSISAQLKMCSPRRLESRGEIDQDVTTVPPQGKLPGGRRTWMSVWLRSTGPWGYLPSSWENEVHSPSALPERGSDTAKRECLYMGSLWSVYHPLFRNSAKKANSRQ